MLDRRGSRGIVGAYRGFQRGISEVLAQAAEEPQRSRFIKGGCSGNRV